MSVFFRNLALFFIDTRGFSEGEKRGERERKKEKKRFECKKGHVPRERQ